MNKHLLLPLLSIFILSSCSLTEEPGTSNFSPSLIQSLHLKLSEQFEIDFQESHLIELLSGINLEELKNGKEYEKEFLFEDFQCDCFDKIKISYSSQDDRINLWVYEEFFEEGLDWCPESSYSYSFIIENNDIVDLQLDYMAG